MSFTPTTPVTGSAQTGLTSPTYTIVADTAPTQNSKQYAVTALGGTQTGVDAHSVARPFTLTAFRPTNLRSLGMPNPLTGRIADVPNNVYTIVTRKGVTPLAGQPSRVMTIETKISVPAGADLADPANVRACQSAHEGTLAQVSASFGDTTVSGLL
jgi:hypothetical protein